MCMRCSGGIWVAMDREYGVVKGTLKLLGQGGMSTEKKTALGEKQLYQGQQLVFI